MTTDLTILPTDEGGRESDVTTLFGDAGESYVSLDEYPEVAVDIALDLPEGTSPDAGRFRVLEDDLEREVRSVEFGRSAIDLVFVFDDTGSMSDEIAAMQRGAKRLTDAIDARGIDARYGLVSFKNDPELDLRFTRNADELKRAVDDLYASGGGYYLEDNFGGIELALDMDFRPDADPVIVDITDAPAHHRDGDPLDDIGEDRLDRMLDEIPDPVADRYGDDLVDEFIGGSDYVMDEVARDLDRRDALFVSVAPDLDDPDKSLKTLAGRVGGLWTDIDTYDFDRVLERITDLVASTYSLEYVTRFEPGDSGELRVIYEPRTGRSASDEAHVSMPRDATRTTVGGSGSAGASGSTGGSGASGSTGGSGASGSAGASGASRSTSAGGSSAGSGGTDLPPYCPKCGTDLDQYSGVSFCPGCGSSMEEY